jgi:Tol biopolymer transport system component
MAGDNSEESIRTNDYFPEGFDAACLPEAQAVRAQTDRILRSKWFVRSPRIQRLFTYLVESTLAGQDKRLKESVVGMEVFDRPPDYDPKADSIVRVEMRRTRTKLRDYYVNEGQSDDVLVWLDKGSYVPIFAARSRSAVTQGGSAPSLTLTIKSISDPPEVDLNASAPGRLRERGKAKGKVLGLAGGAALLLGVCGLYFLDRASQPARLPKLFPLTGNAGLEISPAFSPDGKQVAYAWNGDRHNLNIFIKAIEGGAPRRLTDGDAHHIHPAWSPDGKRIAFLRVSPLAAELVTMPITGGAETVITQTTTRRTPWHPDRPEGSDDSGPVWSRDGSYLLVAKYTLFQGHSSMPARSGIIKTYLNGREEPLTIPPAGIWDSNPALSPSGNTIAFVRSSSGHSGDIYIVSSGGGDVKRLTSGGRDLQGITWLDEDLILYSAEQGQDFRLYQVSKAGGQPRLFSVSSDRPQSPAVSADRHWLAFVQSRNEAHIWKLHLEADKPGSPAQPFITSAATDSSPAYSPDGTEVVFVSDRTGSRQLWLAGIDGTNARQLTSFAGSTVGSPRWAPDGRRIVFDASFKGPPAIWLINRDGNDLHRLTNSKTREYLPSWSRDGLWVYFTAFHDGNDQLWRRQPESGESRLVTTETCIDAQEWLDNQIYCQMAKGGIWQMPLAGGKLVPVPELIGVSPSRYWRLAGNSLYFIRGDEAPRELDALNLTTRRIRKLADIPGEVLYGTSGLAVSPDSRSLLFVQMDQVRSSIVLQEQ